ncbi:FG-GAP-like repeat-containing protein [Pontibacter sp. G13]|uniref:FG-GAP-like repeat-containing protein n=1 Tax=Pontibacter sp. G13 TaxID=3074898 RepID=UPI00288B5F3B|nr:FG-GAP-like repeat-containing protein [Pontibacter sp. G13]WNJ19140.1 FG-GAP-like repeat-containing protein [Pontibacter sp. G13]
MSHFHKLVLAGMVLIGCILHLGDGFWTKHAVDIQRGAQLAEIHCGGCHQVPTPDFLPKRSWNFLLCDMGLRLGIQDREALWDTRTSVRDNLLSRELNLRQHLLVPDRPVPSPSEWNHIRAYYEALAPEEAAPQPPKPEIRPLKGFTPLSTSYRIKGALTSLIHIDTVRHRLLVGDSRTHTFSILDSTLELQTQVPVERGPVDVWLHQDQLHLLYIGDLMAQSPGEFLGGIIRGKESSGGLQQDGYALTSLHRPCDMEVIDLYDDGLYEWAICNFGDHTGRFAIYHPRVDLSGELRYREEVLLEAPGAVKVQVADLDGDGLQDLGVLFAHADEHLSIFYNQGDGTFRRKRLLVRHPGWGYLDLKFMDIDHDGDMDILTANGDNGDSDPYNTLKREHGIRIYLQGADHSFRESYHYPMYGVNGFEVADFDGDGDEDIAAVAFHPDFHDKHPEGFIYLENQANGTFEPKTHPATFGGRWMTLDSGDLDGDGDIDLALGAGYAPLGMFVEHGELLSEMAQNGPSILVLENTLR